MPRENLFSVVVGETMDGRGKVNATRGSLVPVGMLKLQSFNDVSTVHLGYNDVSLPQSHESQIAINNLLHYLERLTEGASIIDSMRSNRSKEDIVVPGILITRVDCRK